MARYRMAAALVMALAPGGAMAQAAMPQGMTFASIDGGDYRLDDWRGHPILIANTASLCAFTPQYEGLQALYDAYRDRGLVVLAVPSDDFRQELGSEAEVKEFCDLTYGLDLPMTTITPVRGAAVHPFFDWVEAETGFVPGWNFNKVLIGADGTVLGTWGSAPSPQGPAITGAVEAALGG